MAKKIEELAPTLVAAGVSADEVKHELRPKKEKPKPEYVPPPIKPLRYRQALALLASHPEMTNLEIALKVTTITEEIVAKLRKEVTDVKKELKDLEPIEPDAPMEVTPAEPIEGEVKPKVP
jgi:hypothetical protein